MSVDTGPRSSVGDQRLLPASLGIPGAFVLQMALFCVLGNVFGNITWGLRTSGPAFVEAWLLGGMLQLCVAWSVADLASAHPVAGGCYGWLRQMSRVSLSRLIGYLLLVGYIAALADNDAGLATAVLTFAGVAAPSHGPLVAITLICLVAQTALCLLSLRVAAHGVGIAVVAAVLVVFGIVVALALLGLKQSPGVFLNAVGIEEHEHLPQFLLVLLIPAWTFTGLDALGNFAAEAKNTARTLPTALMSATIATLFCGTALFVVPLLATPNVASTTEAPSALLFIVQRRMGTGAAVLLSAVDLSALFFLPVVLQLAAARLLRVQALDGAWPAAPWLAIRTKRGVPAPATLFCGAIAAVLYLAWPILFALGTVWPALFTLAYGITIAVGLSVKQRLGTLPTLWSRARDLLVIIWLTFLTGLLLLFDAAHAVPLFVVVVLLVLVAHRRWIKPRRSSRDAATLPADSADAPDV